MLRIPDDNLYRGHQLKLHSLEDSFDDLSRSFEAMMDGMTSRDYFGSSGRETWEPPVNVYELADKLVVCVELAGVQPGELDVQVDEGVLHIRGRRSKPVIPDAAGQIQVHLMEIDSGKFHRKITVPKDVNLSASSASYKSGYVWIILPRATTKETQEQA